MSAGLLGQMRQPNAGNAPIPGVPWAADNGAFSTATEFDADRWLGWLTKQPTTDCLFAVVPDVVGDHPATLALWAEWSPVVRSLGHRPAFVLQDGCAWDAMPPDTDCVFVGGSTNYKLSFDASECARVAKGRGWWVHLGRVNSRRRLRIAAAFCGGEPCDSVDGTFLAFGPEKNLPKLLAWLHPAQGELL